MYTKHINSLIKASSVQRVLLLGGQPGTGKTSFAHWLASELGAGVATYLCHAWSSDEDLFAGVDIPSLVRNDADNVIRAGVLRAVAEASHAERVMMLIDELDKAPARFEALLLGFLERWEYPLQPGYVGTANPDNIWVVLTHNGLREIGQPLQRRCFRYTMPFLPEQVEISLLGGGKLAASLVKIAGAMRQDATMTSPALSELRTALALIPQADSAAEARELAVGCLAKSEADAEFVGKRASALWTWHGEIMKNFFDVFTYPVTARQLQRLAASKGRLRLFFSPAADSFVSTLGVEKRSWGQSPYFYLSSAQADRLASRWPNAVYVARGEWTGIPLADPEDTSTAEEAGDYVPKGTDEVADSDDMADGDLHGGNNNSQEVAGSHAATPSDTAAGAEANASASAGEAEAAPNSAAAEQESTKTQNSASCEVRVSPFEDPSKAASEAAAQGTPAYPGTEEAQLPPAIPQGQPETNDAESAGIVDLSAQQRHPAAAQADEQDPRVLQWEADLAAALALPSSDDKTPSGKPGRRSNAAFYQLSSGRLVSAPVLRAARAALSEWIGDFGDQEYSGRWDTTELAVRARLKSDLNRAKREELGHPSLLVMVDVSGSCMGFASDMHEVALAVAEIGLGMADIIIVSHSNGYPQEMSVNGGEPMPCEIEDRHRRTSRGDWTHFAAWYVELAQRYSITHVLALGDADAQNEYQALAGHPQIDQLVWLDNYNCNQIKPTRGRDKERGIGPRCRWVYGCKDAADFAAALKLAVRS